MKMIRFVDRDMFMRFRGGGIGHKATWDWNDFLFSDAGKPVDNEGDDSEMQEATDSEEFGQEAEPGEVEVADEDQGGDGDGDEVEDDEDNDEDEDEDIKAWKRALQHPSTYSDNDDSESEESEDESDDKDPDRVIPDGGEELDDDVYAREGYGVL